MLNSIRASRGMSFRETLIASVPCYMSIESAFKSDGLGEEKGDI